MATKIYINTDLKDLTANAVANKNRPSQVVRLPQIVEGETVDVELSLVNSNGGYDSRSGDAAVDLAVAISAKGAVATSGTFTLTAGTETTAAIPYNASAEALQNALNDLNSKTGPYGSTVTVKKLNIGSYRIIFDAVGARTIFGGTSIDIAPESEVTIGTSVVGSATIQAQMIIEISQQPAIYTSTWTTGSNKFSGQLDANTARVQELIATGQDAFFEVKAGNDVLCQIPISVLSAVAAPNSLPAHVLPSNLNDFANDPSTNGKFNVTNWLTDLLAPHTKAVWGYITGTLSDQTDLQAALDAKGSASDVSTNTTNIATNTTEIDTLSNSLSSVADQTATNTSNIATNTSNISTNASGVSTNASNIATNASDISTNASAISSNASAISTNSDDISALDLSKAPLAGPAFTGNPTAPTKNAADNSTSIATTAYVDAQNSPNNKGFFANPAALISAYATGQSGWYAIVGTTDTFWVWDADDSAWEDTDSNSAGTVTSISVTGGTGIDSTGSPVTVTGTIDVALDSATQSTLANVSTNASAISTNATNIATNTSDIATNTSDIATNTSDIATNASDISTNTSDISTNTSDIATNASGISTNTAAISTNTSNISTNASGVSTNASNIASNTSNIASNTSAISTNVANISTNTSGISSNASDISTNTSDIATNASDIATNTSNIATNASNIASNTSSISTNTSDVSTNASGIATNASNISSNTSDIATNTSAIATNTSAIATNASGVSTNASNISTNTSNIATNTSDISTNASDISTNTSDIATNASGVSTNASNIASNTSSISTNASDISALDLSKANLASPGFTGNPTAPTQNAADNSTKLATTAYVDAQSSPNNKGFFATESALTTAYATGQSGWYAIVGSTDTFWVWDADTSAWKNTNSDSQGTVTSVSVTGGTGLASTGSPVTTSGSIALELDTATQNTLAKVATNESAIATNTSAIATNTADIASNDATLVSHTNNILINASNITANQNAIALNTAKVGITTAQANAITSNTNDVQVNAANIAQIATDTNTNTSDIATNVAALLLKAPIADPDFTGTVGIAKSGVNGVLDINGNVYIENGKIEGDTGSLDFDSNQAQLILGTFKSDAIKVERVDANSTLIFKVDASSATTGKATMLNAEVSNNLTVSGKSVVKEIESFGGAGGSPDGITIDALHGTLNLNADDNVEVDATGTIKLDAGQTVALSSDLIINDGDIDVDSDHRISVGQVVTSKILCEGAGGSATAQPITYDSKEHRFRDYDGSTNGPTNMLVVNKFDGYTGARVGINKDPSSSNAVALHIVAGQNSSTGVKDTGLKVIGDAFFDNTVRVGHYATADRPTSPIGSIIYNSTTHEFEGFCGNGKGWKQLS